MTPYIPLLVNFTHEDKAARGLRSLSAPAAPGEAATHFSAAEIVEAGGPVLLLGERGSGKTEFARRLARDRRYRYVGIQGPTTLDVLLADPRPGEIPVIDGVDRLADAGPAFLADALARYPDHLLVLGETTVAAGWPIPPGYHVHTILPLSVKQRSAALAAAGIIDAGGRSPPAANPALFALSIGLPTTTGTAEELVDAWLDGRDADGLAEAGFAALGDGTSRNRSVDGLLAARHLMGLPVSTAADLFAAAPHTWGASLASLARRLDRPEILIGALLDRRGDVASHGALLGADVLAGDSPALPAVRRELLRIVEQARMAPVDRDRAARALARGGDPRDLEALADVPGGEFTMGSGLHPNSTPPHRASVAAFRIGRYPVTNRQYARFIQATGRHWALPDGHLAERANAPATDVTWHDARAYCDWLTTRWRSEGRIARTDRVRLPTEPEWERAARGDRPDDGACEIYPWRGGWDPDAANMEHTGLNRTCAVGLFPKGQSPYGCWDMAGQAWEWTSTLWGDDMTSPSFAYPYRDDGRERPDAPARLRRVLRGGCFSSGRQKANCTYRGSLEPDGFWRGNGFRVVVAPERDRDR